MARSTRAAALDITERNAKPGDEAVQLLYALLASASNPDGTPFTLPVDVAAPPPAGVADTLTESSSAPSPAAAATLAVITAPPVGVYRVDAQVALTGTAETSRRNLQLRQNGVVVGTLLTLTDRVLEIEFPRVTVAGGNLDLLVVAAGVVGAIYNVALTATRIG